VFGAQDKRYALSYDDDDDPAIDVLRLLDYRYMRFSYHPLKDKFVLINSWKDPAWTNVKTMRTGIDGEEKESREQVFGKNLIDIKEKTIAQLLVDEVWHCRLSVAVPKLISIGLSPFLCVSDCKSHSLVCRRVLLLRCLYFRHFTR
jgi:cation-transporting ATPase 13A2